MNKKENSGFSLLEMSIVVVIIGMTIGLGILSFNQYSRMSKAELTRDRMKIILKAIDDYFDKFNSLPCPASSTLAFTSDNFGLGLKTGGTDDCSAYDSFVDNTYVGMVPVNTLNIYPSLALDGWGNRIRYAVKASGVVNSGVAATTTSIIKVKNYSGSSTYALTVVVVMSHGENAYGAWKGSGGSRYADGSNTQENYNSNISTEGFRTSITQVGFDDIVYFLTKDQLMNNAFE